MKNHITIILVFIIPLLLCSNKNEKEKERIQKLYGENKEIEGEYDKSLSATCHNGIFVGLKNNDVLSFKESLMLSLQLVI